MAEDDKGRGQRNPPQFETRPRGFKDPVDPDARQHPARIDRPAQLRHKGRKMRGDEGQLIAAGKEAKEDQPQ